MPAPPRSLATTLPGADARLRGLFSTPALRDGLERAEGHGGMRLLEGSFEVSGQTRTTNYLKFELNRRQREAYGGLEEARVLCNLLLHSDPPYSARLVHSDRGRHANNQSVIQVALEGGKRATLDISKCESYTAEAEPAYLLVHFSPACLDQVVQLVVWIGNLTPREPPRPRRPCPGSTQTAPTRAPAPAPDVLPVQPDGPAPPPHREGSEGSAAMLPGPSSATSAPPASLPLQSPAARCRLPWELQPSGCEGGVAPLAPPTHYGGAPATTQNHGGEETVPPPVPHVPLLQPPAARSRLPWELHPPGCEGATAPPPPPPHYEGAPPSAVLAGSATTQHHGGEETAPPQALLALQQLHPPRGEGYPGAAASPASPAAARFRMPWEVQLSGHEGASATPDGHRDETAFPAPPSASAVALAPCWTIEDFDGQAHGAMAEAVAGDTSVYLVIRARERAHRVRIEGAWAEVLLRGRLGWVPARALVRADFARFFAGEPAGKGLLKRGDMVKLVPAPSPEAHQEAHRGGRVWVQALHPPRSQSPCCCVPSSALLRAEEGTETF